MDEKEQGWDDDLTLFFNCKNQDLWTKHHVKDRCKKDIVINDDFQKIKYLRIFINLYWPFCKSRADLEIC